MSDDSGLSRRQFVQALAATGTLGLVSGAGTRAFLNDGETFPDNGIEAWSGVDVTVVGKYVAGPLESVPEAESAWGKPGGGSFGVTSLSSGGNSKRVAGNSEPISAGNSEPVGAGNSEPISAGNSEPVSAGNSEPVSAGNSEPVGFDGGASTDDSAPARGVLSVGPLVSGRPQTLVLSLGIDSCDPVDVWFRMRPENPQSIDLAKVRFTIDMRVALAPAARFDEVQYAGKMGDLVKGEFSSGTLVSSGCTGTSSLCQPLFLGLEWTMPEGRSVDEDVTAEYVLDVFASQCNRTNSQNPWS